MAIPGQTRIGQGFPGGAAALSPGVTGTVPGLPTFESTPHIQAPAPGLGLGASSGLGLTGGSAPQQTQGPPPSAKAYKLAEVMDILQRVRKGYLSKENARVMLRGTDKKIKMEIFGSLLKEHDQRDNPDLVFALDLPMGTRKAGSRLRDVPGNLSQDLVDTVTGSLPGLALAAKSVGADVKDMATLDYKGVQNSETYKNVLKPVGQQYAETYGPLLHGDLRTFGSRVAEHPLGPVLDVASIASAGIGGSARATSALKAVRDLKATRAAMGVKLDPKAAHALDKTFDIADEIDPGLVDHMEDLHTHLYRTISKDVDPLTTTSPIDVANPQGFLSRAGGIFETLRSVARNEKDLAKIAKAEDEFYGSLGTNLSADEMKRLGGPPQTLLHDVTDALDPDSGLEPSFPRASEEGIGREDPAAVWKEAEARIGQPTYTKKQIANAARQGFMRPEHRGGLIDAYERSKGITHEQEITTIMEEIQGVLDDPNLRMNRRTPREVAKEVISDLQATRRAGRQRPGEMARNLPGFISAGTTGRLLSAGETVLREASDLVRAGAIYLRPAYLPNNWAGNEFLNLVQQGVFAPVNLAKSFAMDKHLGTRYARAIDTSLGHNAAQMVVAPKGRGYVGSVTHPVAEVMGQVADQPFRRAAWLHEARRKGYRKLSDVQKLVDRAANGDETALREMATIARSAQEEIVKFGHMNDMERGVLRNLVFVYSWMRGAGRYAGRFPLQHPIQAAAMTHLGEKGKDWIEQSMGGVPSFLIGAVPVGRDKNGNPILINPFSLNPLGTGVDIAKAAAGTIKVLKDPNSFNKFAEEDLVGLTNPIIQAYLEAREGGNRPTDELQRSIAPLRLVKELKHPGSGGVYPTSRKEAVGKFVFGTLFPRQADQAAIDRSVERQNVGHPEKMIPQQMETYKKLTGQDMPEELVTAYKRDLEAKDDQKDFQKAYAKKHGSTGFRNLPPSNRLKAAIEYHRKLGTIPDQELNQISASIPALKTDAAMNDLANALWAATGVGQVKRLWDDMIRQAQRTQLSRERP